MPYVKRIKEYDLPKGETVEKWVSENWETTEMEYYLKDQDNGIMYHLFPVFSYALMIDLGFSHDEAEKTYYILAPVGKYTQSGDALRLLYKSMDTSTWHLYNPDGEIVSR